MRSETLAQSQQTLRSGEKDGNKENHSRALSQLKIIVNEIWRNHIIKEINL